MKSKKPKKTKKIKPDLFQEVNFEMKSADSAVLVLICAVVFGSAFFAGGQVMGGYNEKVARIFREGSALAAENQKNKNISSVEKNIPLEGEKFSETMLSAADSLKNLKIKAKAKKNASQRAAATARILSGPVPTMPGKRMSDGRRLCTSHSSHPQRGGKIHVDEDCCADYNETPNPRCYYPPEKMVILQK